MTTKQLPTEVRMRIALFDTKPSCTNCKYLALNGYECDNKIRNALQYKPDYWAAKHYCRYFDPKPPR